MNSRASKGYRDRENIFATIPLPIEPPPVINVCAWAWAGAGAGGNKEVATTTQGGEEKQHTVNDGTNDLVNLSDLRGRGSSFRAGESGQRRKTVGSERLESGASDGGGRTSKSSPPEGPGETTINEVS